MAVNQAVHLLPDLTTIVAIVEKLSEPGSPRTYWDGAAKAWVPGAAHVPVAADPDIPGIYRLLVPSADTASWPDGFYRMTLLNTEIGGDDRVATDPWDVLMMGGDDGGLGHPSLTLTVPWIGVEVTIWGARINPPKKG